MFAAVGAPHHVAHFHASYQGDLGIFSILADCDIAALLAIDLHHQGDLILNQQISFDFRPIGLRNQPGAAQHGPALLGQMRHHGREQLNKDDRGLLDGPRQVRGRRLAARQRVGQRIGEFTDVGEADVEMEFFNARRDLIQRAMGGLA